MASLIDKIEMLIKREKTSPDKNKEDPKSSNEILTELFGVFNAAPPEINEAKSKKSKKSKKKHKKEKKKRSRSSSSSDSDDSDYSRKKKKKKSKKKKKDHSRERSPSLPPIKPDPDKVKVEVDKKVKIKLEPTTKQEPIDEKPRAVHVKTEDSKDFNVTVINNIDASMIPMPDSPKDSKLDVNDLRLKLDGKNKIQIKNLKFSAVFEETVKKAEEEARKKAEKLEDGEYTDSSSVSLVEDPDNSQFPKSSDPGGILKKHAVEEKQSERKSKHLENLRRSLRDRSRSKDRRRSRSNSRKRHRSRSRSRQHRSSSRSRRRSGSRSRRRSGSRSRSRRSSRSRHRSRSRQRLPSVRSRVSPRRGRRLSPSGVKLADSEKKRLLEVARRNAIHMLKNGAVPAGAAGIPPHTRAQLMAAIQSGGKSVDELTDFCKHLSKKEALGELSSCSSGDEGSENEDIMAFHHPFLVKEKAPIVMNIRGGAPLPVKSNALALVNKDELRLQFPVSSGTQHRSSEWVPVSPKKDDTNMQVAKINHKAPKAASVPAPEIPAPLPLPAPAPLALPAPVPVPAPVAPALPEPMATMSQVKGFSSASPLSLAPLPALPAPGPQAYPPGVAPPLPPPPEPDISLFVSEKLSQIRKTQEESELCLTGSQGFGFPSREVKTLGQFMGSTGAQILTRKELASGMQAWAKKDQLTRAAPVAGGMGMHLLQKMGWVPGKGLGKEGTGTLQPLLLEVKLDTKGLSAKEESGGRVNKMKARAITKRGVPGAVPLIAGGKHPVSLLGEYCSKNKLGPPEYDLCFECGPDHKKNFLFKVRVAGVEYQPAVASQNKKQAKADAAQLALQKLGILP